MLAEESVHFLPLGRASDEAWSVIAGGDSGFLRIGPNHRIFHLSMFHQLHCLKVINLGFSKGPIATPEHLHHCLNYLRQGALCMADLSLEPGDFEEKDFNAQRTGATHTCKDWGVVYSMMEKNFIEWKNITGQA